MKVKLGKESFRGSDKDSYINIYLEFLARPIC